MTGSTLSFSRSSTTYATTAVRLALLWLSIGENEFSRWMKDPVIASALVDPVFTWHYVREAAAISGLVDPASRFLDAYAFPNALHLPPLLLAFCETALQNLPASDKVTKIIIGTLLIWIDYLVARSLETLTLAAIYRLDAINIWEEALQDRIPEPLKAPLANIFEISAESVQKKDDPEPPLVRMSDLPLLVSQMYYSSPVTILCSAIGCFRNVQTLLLVQALSHAASSCGSIILSAFFLALATYIDVHSAIMIVPMALWVHRRGNGAEKLAVASFVAVSLALQWLSLLLVGSDRFLDVVRTTHLHSFSLDGLQPSLSTLWYLSMELFGRFRKYFTLLLGGVPYLLVLPLAVRLHRYPYALAAIYWALGTLFRPPSTLYSLKVALCLAALSLRSLARMRATLSLVVMCAIPVPVILYVVCYRLWINTAVGEANFVYFQCLAYNLFCGSLLIEFCSATLRRDKILRVTEKLPASS